MIPAVANAPAASAIHTRSKTIQRPHGYVLERWVVAPNPNPRRSAIEITPIATSASIAQLNGVSSFSLSASNAGWKSWCGACASALACATAAVRRLKNAYVLPRIAPSASTAGGTAPRATADFAGYGSSCRGGEPSFSNGTAGGYSTPGPPPPCLPLVLVADFFGRAPHPPRPSA